MKTVADVLKSSEPLNEDEYSVIECRDYTIYSVLSFIVLSIAFLIKGEFAMWIEAFTSINLVTILLLIWILFLISKFLHGYFYLKRFNEAVMLGRYFEGRLIEQQTFRYQRAVRAVEYRYQPVIELKTGEVVKSPKYTEYLSVEKSCDVYLYKKKYYFEFHPYDKSRIERLLKSMKS